MQHQISNEKWQALPVLRTWIFDIHENKIRGGSELKKMLGICNMNLISLQHGNGKGLVNLSLFCHQPSLICMVNFESIDFCAQIVYLNNAPRPGT